MVEIAGVRLSGSPRGEGTRDRMACDAVVYCGFLQDSSSNFAAHLTGQSHSVPHLSGGTQLYVAEQHLHT